MSEYFRKRCQAFGHAIKGTYNFFISGNHAKIHLFAFVQVIILSCYFSITSMEWIAILISSALVIGIEMINTALETLMDKLHPENNEMIGRAKDISAAAVLIAAITAAIIGVIIFTPYVVSIF